jgi:probable HAF family extracellular repeat protein
MKKTFKQVWQDAFHIVDSSTLSKRIVIATKVNNRQQTQQQRISNLAFFTGLGHLGYKASSWSASYACRVSADGSKVVGHSCNGINVNEEAFLWDSATKMQTLRTLGGSFSYANGISADGSKIVGYSYNRANWEAFCWDSINGMQGLGTLGGSCSYACGVSADGSKIVGYSHNGDRKEAFLWDNVKGMQGLGTLGGSFSQAWDISADGTKVVGKSYNGSYTEAFYWNKAQGMRSLKSLLVKDYGLDLTGWTLVEAKGISADGLTIVGWGINPHGLEEGWFVRLIAPR